MCSSSIAFAKMFSKEISNISKDGFKSIEENFEKYDGLIYDGAYSEHITNTSKKGLSGEDVDEEKAKEIAQNFAGNENIKVIEANGLSENGTIECYTFTITLNNNKNKMTVAISKKGGHIVFSDYNRTIEEEKISISNHSAS